MPNPSRGQPARGDRLAHESPAGSPREIPRTRSANTLDPMSQEVHPAAGNHGRRLPTDDDFYICRINWLVAQGRPDLIDEIADDYERRRIARPTSSRK